MRKILALLLLFAAFAIVTACGGGGGTSILPPPGGDPGGGNNPPPSDTRTVSVSGQIAYTGLVLGAEQNSRAQSVAPISNAGIALIGGGNILAATTTESTGWFEVTAENVPADYALKLKVELVGESESDEKLYAELPFSVDGGGNVSFNLGLSAYDSNGDGTPDGFRLQGSAVGGRFENGVFGDNGLDMPFGGQGNHFGWMRQGERFFQGTGSFGEGWSDNFDPTDPGTWPPGMNFPGGDGNFENRIEVQGVVVEISRDRMTYVADGSRLIFIGGLVFEESGRFAVHATEETSYAGVENFGEIQIGDRSRAIGIRLTDNVLQAKRIKIGDGDEHKAFFAVDGKITEILFSGDRPDDPLGSNGPTRPSGSAIVAIDGVLITFDGDEPKFEFGQFRVAVNPETVFVGVGGLWELRIGMVVAMFGPLNPEQLTAKFCVALGLPPTPPPPPPFGSAFHGRVIDVRRDKHLVGVEGFWDDIIYHDGFDGRGGWQDTPPPPLNGDGTRGPSQTDNGGWSRGDDPAGTGSGGGTVPPSDPNGGPIRIWIKIVRETVLEGVENFDGIQPGQNIWSEMMIDPATGRIRFDEEGNPISAFFQVFRDPPPPPPGVFGDVLEVNIFEDMPQNNGIVVINPGMVMMDGNGGGTLPPPPDDPTVPWPVDPVPVRVVPETELRGAEGLGDIHIGAVAEAQFMVNDDGTIVRDDHGAPIAAWLAVYPTPPPPPPPAGVYGSVIETVIFDDMPQNNGLVVIDPFRYGFAGGEGGWCPPYDPTDPGDPNGEPKPVTVRVVPETVLTGAESLAEIQVGSEAEAMFVVNEDGTIALDENGNPIAAWLAVYPIQPPPGNYITFEGDVVEYAEGSYITVSEYVPPGQGRPSRMLTFQIVPDTYIESQSGIQIGDRVFIEGYIDRKSVV